MSLVSMKVIPVDLDISVNISNVNLVISDEALSLQVPDISCGSDTAIVRQFLFFLIKSKSL